MINIVKRATIAALVVGVSVPAFTSAASSAAPTVPETQTHVNATAAPHESVNQLIIANMADHPLDMTIITGDGTQLHSVVQSGSGWYPEADYSGRDTIVVKDDSGVAFAGHFTYDGDWIAGNMTTTPRLRFSWHTNPFGGFDFR